MKPEFDNKNSSLWTNPDARSIIDDVFEKIEKKERNHE